MPVPQILPTRASNCRRKGWRTAWAQTILASMAFLSKSLLCCVLPIIGMTPPCCPFFPSAPIRLMNFTSQSSRIGRVEVLINGTWGTVCDE